MVLKYSPGLKVMMKETNFELPKLPVFNSNKVVKRRLNRSTLNCIVENRDEDMEKIRNI